MIWDLKGRILWDKNNWIFLSFCRTPLSMSVICWRRVALQQVVALVPWSEH